MTVGRLTLTNVVVRCMRSVSVMGSTSSEHVHTTDIEARRHSSAAATALSTTRRGIENFIGRAEVGCSREVGGKCGWARSECRRWHTKLGSGRGEYRQDWSWTELDLDRSGRCKRNTWIEVKPTQRS